VVPTTAAPSASTSADAPQQQPTGSQSPPPTTTTTPPPPVVKSADVRVRLTFSLRPLGVLTPRRTGLLGNLNTTVSGIPAGQKAVLTVKVLGGTLSQQGSGCKPKGSTAVCTIGPGTPTLVFKVRGVPVSATASVSVPNGYKDPVLSNNLDTVLLGLLRLGSLRG
jgi:hypothetical protein